MSEQADVLAIGAHPDDIELGCAGALLKLRSQGRRIAVVDLSRGELGTRGSAELREKEAAAAAKVLGLDFRTNLGLEDGNIQPTPENRLKLIRILRQTRPRLVITHSRWGHPDHSQAAQLVEDAVHHAGLARIDTGQERFRPQKIAFWMQFNQPRMPQLLVDISEFMEVKEEAILAFASQFYKAGSRELETYLSGPDILDQIRSFHKHLGSLIGCHFAEGFLLSRPPRIEDLSSC